jgi:hypothetical protein
MFTIYSSKHLRGADQCSATHSFGGHYQNICDLRMFSNSTARSSKHTARTCTTASAVSSSSTTMRSAEADSDKLHAVYAQVCDKLREVERLSGVSAVLGWDEQVRTSKKIIYIHVY